MSSEWINLVQNVAFPIFVSVYMLTKGSKDSSEMKKVISELTAVIGNLKDHCTNRGGG